MASFSGIEKQPQISSTADIDGPIYSDNRTYIQEPPIKKEKSLIVISQVLFSFSIVGKTHAFLHTLPR